MLLANVAAAEYALEHDVPMLYRVHEAPEFSRIQKVKDFVKLLGLPFPDQPTQADYQRVIEATKDRIDAPSIHAVLLRSMMQAYYGAKMQGTMVWLMKLIRISLRQFVVTQTYCYTVPLKHT